MRLIEFLFPCQCVVCSKVGEYICPKCIKGIPHCLPICCVCNKLSNKGLTHSFCSNINITYFTGWYISEKMSKIFDQKKEKGNFNIHLRLFTTLLNYLKIYDLIKECHVYPLPSKDINTYKLNRILCKNIEGKRKSQNIIFIGDSLEDIEEIQKLIRGLPYSPLNIYILCLFIKK